MSGLPDPALFNEIAIELGVSPSFIEKDWHVVQLIGLISQHEYEDITAVLSGGTSLSKGYALIQRFSEDIDFKVKAVPSITRGGCRQFRNSIIEMIDGEDLYSVDAASITSRNNSRFFSCNIAYPSNFPMGDALRTSGIKLEMGIQYDTIMHEMREIRSFVSEFGGSNTDAQIPCVQPIETAADKFSALIWRVLTRDRSKDLGDRNNDPTIIRHLHDIYALREIASNDARFKEISETAFHSDRGRLGGDFGAGLAASAQQALKVIMDQKTEYQKEYEQFVSAMSYAPDEEQITFAEAIDALTALYNTISD